MSNLGRRRGLTFVGAVALIAAAGCGGDQSESISASDVVEGAPVAGTVKPGSLEGVTVNYTSWGGEIQEGQMAGVKGFESDSGATIVEDSPTDYAKIKAQVAADQGTWDVVDVESNLGSS